MKALLFYSQFLWFISPSIHSNLHSKSSLSGVRQRKYVSSTHPLLYPTCNLEHSSLLLHFTGWELFYQSLASCLENGFPGKRKLDLFFSRFCFQGPPPSVADGTKVMSPMLHKHSFLCWHDAPKAKKPLWKIN